MTQKSTLAEHFTKARALHFNTFGGNPLASAVGMAVLDAIEEDGCQEISDRVGTHLLKGLENMRSEFEVYFYRVSYY